MNINSMDVNILLSIINMKLRDSYSSLDRLCDDMDISEDLLKERLKTIDYHYCSDTNQFK